MEYGFARYDFSFDDVDEVTDTVGHFCMPVRIANHTLDGNPGLIQHLLLKPADQRKSTYKQTSLLSFKCQYDTPIEFQWSKDFVLTDEPRSYLTVVTII